MSYAGVDDVLARAGRFAGVFQVTGQRPDEADLGAFLDQVTAVIDAKIQSRGFDPAELNDEIRQALLDVNAWAVLIRALPAAIVGDDAADKLLEQAREIVSAAGFEELAAGTSEVFSLLETIQTGTGGGGTGSGAGSLWDELGEPEEERDADEIAEAAAPVWSRGQSL